MIELQDVSYVYPERTETALKNINLSIKPSEFVAVVGRNGSGKTTLARMLNGLFKPLSGTVLVDGLNTLNAQDNLLIKRKVGLVMSVPDNQIVGNTVEEDIAFGPENLGLTSQEIKIRVDRALHLVGMEAYRNFPPYVLSGGQKQKVCIASLLAMEPEYMILDEPTVMVGPEEIRQLVEIVTDLHNAIGMGVIWITHNLEEVFLADRILVLQAGRLLQDVPTAELLPQFDLLLELGIQPLEITEIINELNHRGDYAISPAIIDMETLAEYICRLKLKI